MLRMGEEEVEVPYRKSATVAQSKKRAEKPNVFARYFQKIMDKTMNKGYPKLGARLYRFSN